MTTDVNPSTIQCGNRVRRRHPTTSRALAAAIAAATLCLQATHSLAAESAAAPAIVPNAAPPAGAYKLDKSHGSLVVRASHMGFSTYTTRFSRFDADLTFDPKKLAAATLVATIDATSFEMDSAPQMCLDIMKGPKMLDTTKFPKIVFKSDSIRRTGAKSMAITGTLSLHGVSRPMVLAATYNGGYAGMANMDPNARVGFSAHGSLKRSGFGIAFGIPAPGSTIGVGDSIDFSIEAEFTGPPLVVAAAVAH